MRRVVFCPYLSAMWASLSPLYAEHTAAGDDVTVMPLPYAVKDPDGRPIAYQTDDSFPVPVTEANIDVLREMHPDTIYFHNPYDGNNIITQVHPAFHSKHLGACIQDLVYVPYYTMPCVPGGDVGHIIMSPGVRRANRIVVYSQESAETHRKILGSDKYIVVKQRPEPRKYTMPKEWRKIARGRRLVMLGTSLAALMDRKEEEFGRIYHAIEINQDEHICLLWRPHPLYEATLIAMFPKLQERYHAIVRNYTEREKGIFDTSWDVERAVTLCSEYIGDPSSLMAFFHEQGKPVQLI